MASAKPSLLITLHSCMSKKVSSYTKASVNKLRELLEKRHNKKIKRRWTFYCLADFEKDGLITRRVRIINNSDGTVKQLSSMISFTIKGLKLLISMKVEGSILALKQKLAWLNGEDKRFPTGKEVSQGEVSPLTPSDSGRLADLAKMVFTPV